MLKTPEKVYIAKEDKEKFIKLEQEGLFEGRNQKDQFIIAMGVGFINKTPLRSFENKQEFFWQRDLRLEDTALVNAIAVYSKNDINVLSDMKEVYQIAEQYAHAGIDLLVNKVETQQLGSFWKHFEKYIYDYYSNLKFKK